MAREPRDREYVEYRARTLARKYARTAPVDLFSLAHAQCVKVIQLRVMIPEGVTHAVDGGFIISVRHTRNETVRLDLDDLRRPLLSYRQRFTLSHEIAHTLYFGTVKEGLAPAPVAGIPRGKQLERFCDRAARLLLVPDHLFAGDLLKRRNVNVTTVLWLQRQYRASTIVILGRIAELHIGSGEDRAVLRVNADTMVIEAAFIPRRLLPLVPHPKPYETKVSDWAGHLVSELFWDTPSAQAEIQFRGMHAIVARVEYSRKTFYAEVHAPELP